MYSAYFWWHDRIEGVYSSSMFVFPGSSTCPILFVILHSHLWVIFTSLLSLTHVELLPTTGNSLFPSMWSMHYFSKNSIYIFSSLEAFFWYWSQRCCCYLTRLMPCSLVLPLKNQDFLPFYGFVLISRVCLLMFPFPFIFLLSFLRFEM